jgi:hypothetical protein
MTIEGQRLRQGVDRRSAWRRWGPYLSERQWGTVREDYSPDGTAWDYFPHDHARSRAYRWGEDGLAGFSDDQQVLCLSLALWNGRDPILKERLFGLTNREGNHGEDVKECYYYLDATPTHSYLKTLYKYPQSSFPYTSLLEENRRRDRNMSEFEIFDTHAFNENRYFDIFIEYAKDSPDDILMFVTVYNRGPEQASIHVRPQLWFRNTWSWADDSTKPALHRLEDGVVSAFHPILGPYHFYADGHSSLLFCDNETNPRRMHGRLDAAGYFKDAFHEYLIQRNHAAVNPESTGTKVAARYILKIPPGAARSIRVGLFKGKRENPFASFEDVLAQRRSEADEFYGELQRGIACEHLRQVQRQAFAGMIWSKQFFYYDVPQWLNGDPAGPQPPENRKRGRNTDWIHLNNADIISMPDKWEYPWYAAWDLAFHTVVFALIDPEFAKEQLVLLTREWYMHPNGQLPAYEWAFQDVNPPVHGWAAWRVFQIDREQRRHGNPDDPGDLAFLERIFHKLMLNFTWWVNRKDASGKNIFHGGFLGLDNIGVFDRNAPLPTGGHISQSDATSWMAMFSLNLMRVALELAQHNHVYEDIATKFFEHFLQIARAMTDIGEQGIGLWDEADNFFYDMLNFPDGRTIPLKVRSMVGLIPLFAVETLDAPLLDKVPEFTERLQWFLNYRPDLAALVSRWNEPASGDRRLLSLLRGHRMKLLLRRMLDETEFLSDFGVRSLSRIYADHPYTFNWDGCSMTVQYEPAESQTGIFGGNSNWRGPIWFPVNFLIIESLQKFYDYYGNDFRVECPTGSGNLISLKEVAAELSRRLIRLFVPDANGFRPMDSHNRQLSTVLPLSGHLNFYEYFDGDTGRGVGASHQTGWTGLVAKLIHQTCR